jgi:hypothetical protein
MMDTSKMKVTELRAELKKRGLETGGVKAELTTRLTEALENAEDSDGESADTERDKEEEEEEEEKPQKRQKSESESLASPDKVAPLLLFQSLESSSELFFSFSSFAVFICRHLVGAKRF